MAGWVKNRRDGKVELLAEGEEEGIREMVLWAQHGTSAARVDDVDVRWRGYTGEFSEFRKSSSSGRVSLLAGATH